MWQSWAVKLHTKSIWVALKTRNRQLSRAQGHQIFIFIAIYIILLFVVALQLHKGYWCQARTWPMIGSCCELAFFLGGRCRGTKCVSSQLLAKVNAHLMPDIAHANVHISGSFFFFSFSGAAHKLYCRHISVAYFAAPQHDKFNEL